MRMAMFNHPTMKSLVASLLLALPLSCICADDAELLHLTSKYEGREYVCAVRVSDIADGSLWPDGQEPPLSPRRAAQMAQVYLDTYISETSVFRDTRWRLEAVHLSSFGSAWCYIIDCQRMRMGTGYELPFKVVVLMNGKVIKHTEQKYHPAANMRCSAAPLDRWTVQVIEASQARHDMVSLNRAFRFAKSGGGDRCSRPGVSGVVAEMGCRLECN